MKTDSCVFESPKTWEKPAKEKIETEKTTHEFDFDEIITKYKPIISFICIRIPKAILCKEGMA